MPKFRMQGVCSSEVEFHIEEGIVRDVHFVNGCPGNLQALSILIEGMPAEEVARKLRGIVCQNGTSCADQLAAVLEKEITRQMKKA